MLPTGSGIGNTSGFPSKRLIAALGCRPTTARGCARPRAGIRPGGRRCPRRVRRSCLRISSMRIAELPGRRLRYEESGGEGSGEGPPVVFLHAGSGSSRMWEHQIPDFTVAGYRFIAYDRRTEGSAVDDLEALADHLVLDRFHLVGTAAGGIVAVDYALSFPQRLLSL